MEILAIVLLYIYVIIFHFMPYWKSKNKPEIILSGTTIIITFILLMLFEFGIDLPDLTLYIKKVIKLFLNN